MNKEGRKPFRGTTKEKTSLTLTGEGKAALSQIAELMGLPSRSEVIEELAREKLAELLGGKDNKSAA